MCGLAPWGLGLLSGVDVWAPLRGLGFAGYAGFDNTQIRQGRSPLALTLRGSLRFISICIIYRYIYITTYCYANCHNPSRMDKWGYLRYLRNAKTCETCVIPCLRNLRNLRYLRYLRNLRNSSGPSGLLKRPAPRGARPYGRAGCKVGWATPRGQAWAAGLQWGRGPATRFGGWVGLVLGAILPTGRTPLQPTPGIAALPAALIVRACGRSRGW